MDATQQLLVNLAIVSVNVLLHSTGCFLLWKTYKRSQVTTQKLLLFHLSISEGLMNLNLVVIFAVHLCIDFRSESYKIIYTYIIHPMRSSLFYVIFFIMLFMTLDRLMAVVLNLKYQIYWRVTRTKKVLAAIWIFGLLLSVCFGVFPEFTPHRVYILILMIHIYLQLAFSIFFVVTALLTYAIIFWKYKMSRNSLETATSNGNGQHQQHSRTHFYIPVLIISTYMILNATPFIMVIFFIDKSVSGEIATILFYIGYMSDALIYIFLQPKVRKQLFVCCRRRNSAEPTHNITLQSIADRTLQVDRIE